MGWESSDVVRFDLGPLLQGQMRVAKLKSAFNFLLLKNAVFLLNYVSWPFPVDTSCIWPQMHPWSSYMYFHLIVLSPVTAVLQLIIFF